MERERGTKYMNTPTTVQPRRVRSFKDLIVWEQAMDLAVEIYRFTEALPADERYGLTAQMRRAAVSAPSNIAEGQARGYRADYRHSLCIALGSLAELETQLILCQRLKLVSSVEALCAGSERIRVMLLRLIKTL